MSLTVCITFISIGRTPRGIGRSLDNAFTPVSSRSSPFPDVMRDIGNRDAHASLPRSWPSQEAPNAVSQRPARQSDPHISQVAGKYSGTPLADPLVRSGGQAIAWIQRYFDFPHPSENTPVGRSMEGTTETPKISEHSPGTSDFWHAQFEMPLKISELVRRQSSLK
jgi:hypothetical protein